MTTRFIQTGTATWRFSSDDPPPLALRMQALLSAQLIDEITAAPAETILEASTENTGLTARVASSGSAGLVGQPLMLYTPGHIAGAPLAMTVQGDGFLSLSLRGNLGAEVGYPDNFIPLDFGVVPLHRAPTTIRGRTVSHTRVTRAGAAVTIDGIWLLQSDLLNPPVAANLISLSPGLYTARPAAGGSTRQFNVAPAPPAEAKRLIGAAIAGDTSLRITNQIGLAAGTLLIIDPPDLGRAEIIAITAIVDPGSGTDLPATMQLAHPLARDHADGATAIRAVPSAASAANALSRDGLPGDVSLFATTMTGLDASMIAVEITGGGPPAEYHWASIYAATSDANGYFRLPPIHRLAQIQLHATHALELNPIVMPVTLDWGRSSLVLDLVFP